MPSSGNGPQMQGQDAPGSPTQLSPSHAQQMMEVDEGNENDEDYFAHGQQIVLHEDK